MTTASSPTSNSLLLAMGLPGQETSIASIRDATKLLRSLRNRNLLTTVLVGVPKTLAERLVNRGVMSQKEVLGVPSQSHELSPGSICVISDEMVPTICHGHLRVHAPTDEHRHPVDHFFKLVAKDSAIHAIGLLLHGQNSDGILGLRAISDSGGLRWTPENGPWVKIEFYP